jgi:hypothetical protein
MAEKKQRSGFRFRVISILVVVIIFMALIEYTVSVLYEPGRSLFPGFDTETAALNTEIFEEDPQLIKRLRPNLDMVHPNTGKPMRTNALGFRGPDFQETKAPGALRVVFLGDSFLFGMGLSLKDTIPFLVGESLGKTHNKGSIEIINLAVPGYTSFQGLKLAGILLPRMKPDLVVVGFGHTDGSLVSLTEEEMQIALKESRGRESTLDRIFEWSSLYELIRNKLRSDKTRQIIGRTNGEASLGARVPPDPFRANIYGIIRSAQEAGAGCLLLDPNLINYYASDALIEIAREVKIPFISARETMERKFPEAPYTLHDSKRYQRFLAIQMREIPQDPTSDSNQVFLVRVPTGTTRYPPLTEWTQFNDQGKMGDLEAGDGIFTATLLDEGDRSFEFAPCIKMLMQQNLTRQLFINHDTFYRLPPVERFKDKGLYYSPVYEFRKPAFHELLMDFNHALPNEKGTRLIAATLASIAAKLMD